MVKQQNVAQKITLPNGDLVVLLDREKINSGKDKQRNIYRISSDGKVKWQVENYQPLPFLSTFTNIQILEGCLVAHNFDGGEYKIDVADGSIIESKLVK